MLTAHAHSPAADDDRSYRAYRTLHQVFLELDDGDKRFLRLLSQAIWKDDTDYVLTIPHFWALVHLGDAEGRTMAELAHLLSCDKSNVTAIVDKLEVLGWARRMRGKAGDRRYLRVVLSESGWHVRRRVMAAHREWVQRRLAVLSGDQLDLLIHMLSCLRDSPPADPGAVVADVVLSAGVVPGGASD